MDALLFWLARLLIGFLQRLELRTVARLGRTVGRLVYWLDARHRRVALRNLEICFRNKSKEEVRALAKENFRRIGENFACAVKTASMTLEELRPHVQFVAPVLMEPARGGAPQKIVAAIGHFGNFELYARFGQFAPGYKTGTTYRGLRQPSLNDLMQSLREKSGCEFFERRFDSAALKAFMHQDGVILGLLADQHGGPRGLRLPFLGVDCATSAAPALFALRYSCKLLTGICYRTGLAQWRIEAGAEIATHLPTGQPRAASEIMLEVNRAFEAAVLKDPANWFWVHNRWKARFGPRSESGAAPATSEAERLEASGP